MQIQIHSFIKKRFIYLQLAACVYKRICVLYWKNSILLELAVHQMNFVILEYLDFITLETNILNVTS